MQKSIPKQAPMVMLKMLRRKIRINAPISAPAAKPSDKNAIRYLYENLFAPANLGKISLQRISSVWRDFKSHIQTANFKAKEGIAI